MHPALVKIGRSLGNLPRSLSVQEASFEKTVVCNILFVRRARCRAPAEKDFCTQVFSNEASWTLKDRGVPSGTANFPSGRMYNFPAGKLCFPRENYTSGEKIMPSGFPPPKNYASRGKIMFPREFFSNNYTTKPLKTANQHAAPSPVADTRRKRSISNRTDLPDARSTSFGGSRQPASSPGVIVPFLS